MRLTLRTLLAWIDGLLPDIDRDELAAKIAVSPVAPRLVERIEEVTARPGLPAPRPDGRGLAEDANTAAEFLDNMLPVERLEAFERVCLDSDIHLAEVAECHTLLAEVARDPGVVPLLPRSEQAQLLEKVSRQMSHPPEESRQREEAALVRVMREAAAPVQPIAAGGRSSPRASLGAWFSAIAALLLLVVLGGLLVRMLWQPPRGDRQVAEADRAAGDASPRETPLPPPVEPPAPAALESPAPEPAAFAKVDAPADVTPPSDAAAAAEGPAAVRDDAQMPAAEGRVASDQPGEPLAAATLVPLPVMEEEAAAEPVRPEPLVVAPRATGGVVGGGPVLHRVDREGMAAWEPLLAGTPLADVEEFIVPPHLYPVLERGGVMIRLLPNTRAAVVFDSDGTPRVEVIFGQAVVWSEAAETTVGITAAGLSGTCTLGPRQPVGVEVTLIRNGGDDPAAVPPGRSVRLITSGGSRWRQTEADGGPPGVPLAGLALEQPLPPRGGLEWESSAAAAARQLPPAAEPSWMQLTAVTDPVGRRAAAAISAGLVPGQSAADSLRGMMASRRAEDRMVAAATLALAGDYEPLIELLCDDTPSRRLLEGQWNELEAATVPRALARGVNAAAALRQAFVARGPNGRGGELFLLARGLSAGELAGGGEAALVAALEDPELVVRRYAIKNLLTLLPDPTQASSDYRPERTQRLNDKGVDWWRARLAGGGLGDGRAEDGPEP